MKEYDTFILKEDLNPVIKKGMRGVILEIYNNKNIEAEFIKDDGTNYEYENSITFCINTSIIFLEETG
jgi:hypothetical protein